MRTFRTPTLLSAILGTCLLSADALAEGVAVWVRTPGNYADGGGPDRTNLITYDLGRLPLGEVKSMDFQYGKKARFKGIKVGELIRAYGPPRSADMALLIFANGMRIPVRISDLSVDPDPLIAVKIWSDDSKSWTDRFPPAAVGKGTLYTDARPLRFGGNKVVVPNGAHPLVPKKAASSFSPWAHADTLTGIELVDERAYFAQFEVNSDEKVAQGLEVFKQSCHFCHSVRHVGAHLGWDFVEPLPVTNYHPSSRSLFFHIAYRESNAAEKGLKMPALKYMKEADAQKLWEWLRAVAKEPVRPYRP